jgi:hypothetical protein
VPLSFVPYIHGTLHRPATNVIEEREAADLFLPAQIVSSLYSMTIPFSSANLVDGVHDRLAVVDGGLSLEALVQIIAGDGTAVFPSENQ